MRHMKKSLLSFHALAALALMAALPARSTELAEVRAALESNLAKVKTLTCEVEVVASMPAGSLQHRYKLIHKYPHSIKAVSLVNPELVHVVRKDTAFYPKTQPKRMDEMLIAMIRPDKQGRLFNPIHFLVGDVKTTTATCGKNVCISYEAAPPKALSDSLPQQARVGQAAGTMEFSPSKKVIEKFSMVAGPASTTTTMEYQKVGGAQLPKTMVIHSGIMKSTVRFENMKVNVKVDDAEFK